jgi:hypothetical protein
MVKNEIELAMRVVLSEFRNSHRVRHLSDAHERVSQSRLLIYECYFSKKARIFQLLKG